MGKEEGGGGGRGGGGGGGSWKVDHQGLFSIPPGPAIFKTLLYSTSGNSECRCVIWGKCKD